MKSIISAKIFTVLTIIVILYQAALAAGLPWGAASMGGRYPGKYPVKMRFVAIFNIIILAFLAITVLARSGLILPKMFIFSKIAVWFVVIFCFLSTIINIITPSKIEHIWVPITLAQFITSMIVALN